jgi:hypothetical protein
MNLNNIIIKEKKAMRKLYGSIASVMLAVLVLTGGTTPVRSQISNFIPYPTLSLRNFHVPPGNGEMYVALPPNGGTRYFLVPIWIWNAVDTTNNPNSGNANPNNSWYTAGKAGAPGQVLQPIRSFSFQLNYGDAAMQLDTFGYAEGTGNGSPVVMTGPSIVSAPIGACSVTPRADTGLASTFFVTFAEQPANNGITGATVIRLAGASSVPLPRNASSPGEPGGAGIINNDSGYSEHNGILFWLRFVEVIPPVVNGGRLILDSAKFNDHYGDTGLVFGSPTSDSSVTLGNFGGGTGSQGLINKGYLDIGYTPQPVFEISPSGIDSELEGQGGQVDSLKNDLVFDPTTNGTVAQSIFINDAGTGGASIFNNVSIHTDQPWLSINCGTTPEGGSSSLFLGWDGIDNLALLPAPQLEGPSSVELWLSVTNPDTIKPGVYYATVTFQNDDAFNSPFTVKLRFVREAAPDEPNPPSLPGTPATGSGIQLQITNSCPPSSLNQTDFLTFGTGIGATDSLDVLYGEHPITVAESTLAVLDDSSFAYFYPLDPNLQAALTANSEVGYTRDIRNDNTDTSIIYQVNFNPGNVNCYPVKVCVDTTQFPAGARVLLKFTLNGSDQPIDLRNATPFNGLECVTITDHRITSFYIEYTPGTIANIATFLKTNSWSLISLPVIPPDPHAGPPNGPIFENALTIPYQYQSSSGWEQQNVLQFGRGYMLRYGSYIGNNATVAGTKSFTVSGVQISEGWNSIGGTSGPGTYVQQTGQSGPDGTLITPTSLPGGQVPALQEQSLWEFTPQTGYDMTNFFLPGRGYFIKVDKPGYWNITTPAPSSTIQTQYPAGKEVAEREGLQGELTQVLLSDADANGQVLYFGNATTTQPESNFEMPGNFRSFDARFDANSGMLSYNHASYVVDLHATSYPVTMKFSNASGSVTVSDMSGNVIGTTSNNGIVTISSPVTQVQVAEKQPDAPSMVGYALEANTPNPFEQSTMINYSLPQESVVSLVVYNELGQVVQTLVNGVVGAGTHQALFDGSQLPNGTYYYTLKAGNFVQTQRMSMER